MARKAQWTDTLISSTVASGAQGIITLMGGMSQIDSRGLTVARTIVRLSFLPPVAVSDAIQGLHFGIGVVGQDAFAASAVPDADVDGDRPPRGWIIRDSVAVPGAASMTNAAPVRVELDIRGMRKVDDGELVLIMDSVAISGTPFIVRAFGIIRVVFLLP